MPYGETKGSRILIMWNDVKMKADMPVQALQNPAYG